MKTSDVTNAAAWARFRELQGRNVVGAKLRPEYLDEHRLGQAVKDPIHAASEDIPPVIRAAVPAADTDIDKTLQERGSRYGKFATHASITQALKSVMHGADKWHQLAPDQQEALDMIAHKIGRILNGDPNYHDSWHDIVGYTKLVADRLARVSV